MADKAEDKLWRRLTKWRPGKWLGHGPQVLRPEPYRWQRLKSEGRPQTRGWGELGSRNSLSLLTCSNVNISQKAQPPKENNYWQDAGWSFQGNANPLHHFTPTRMVTFRKSDNSKYCRWECREIRTLKRCWWECKIMQLLWKTVCQFLKI